MEGNMQLPLASSRENKLLEEVTPCYFPRYSGTNNDQKEVQVADVKLEQLSKFQELAAASEGDLESVLQTAWALFLRCYTGLDEVCFGYREARHEAHGEKCPGPTENEFFSTAAVKMDFEDAIQLSKSVDTARKTYLQRLQGLKHGQEWSDEARPLLERQFFNATIALEKQKCSDTCDGRGRQALLDKIGTSVGVSFPS